MAGQIIVQRGAGSVGGGGGMPGGANTQVQYNDSGAFGGDAGLTFDETTDVLTVEGGLDIDSDAGLLRLGELQDIVLFRLQAGFLGLRNGTNDTNLGIYGTFTNTSNYERVSVGYDTGDRAGIGTQSAGTGSTRPFTVFSDANSIRMATDKDAGTLADTYIGRGNFGPSTSTTPIQVTGHESAISLGSAVTLSWGNATGYNATVDIRLTRVAASVLGLRGNGTGTTGAALELMEQTAPSAGASNTGRIFLEDNGSGKTRAMIQFATGAAVQFAIEP